MMNKESEQEIDITVKMRFIGYYMSDDQFMRTESVYVDKAEELASLLQRTFNSLLQNRFVDEEMRNVLEGNTVFILKGEDNHLYGYYPKYNVARITNVRYIKTDVTPMPLTYKRWFKPGECLKLIKPRDEETEKISD
jgi:cupin superfamily acireductone dioxygenase involved in methionine salvage